jgi:hypothetical protein
VLRGEAGQHGHRLRRRLALGVHHLGVAGARLALQVEAGEAEVGDPRGGGAPGLA